MANNDHQNSSDNHKVWEVNDSSKCPFLGGEKRLVAQPAQFKNIKSAFL